MINFDEFIVWIVSSALLGILLSTQFQWPILSIEPADLLLMFAFSLVMLFIYVAGQKIAAWYYNCDIKIKFLSFRQYWFRDTYRFKWPFPLWLVLPVLLFLITAGKFKWLAIMGFDIEAKKGRIRKRFSNIDDVDVAKIVVAGPAASLIFALILKVVGLASLAIYPALLAFLTCIPIGSGFKILAGSRNLTVFFLVLTGVMLFLIPLAGWFPTLIVGLLTALFIVVAYYVIYEQ
jgi:hypothetical protein